METKSFRIQILTIFIVLTIVLFSIALYTINTKYRQLNSNYTSLHISKTVQAISMLLQSIQMERGLSSDYLTSTNNIQYKTKLLQREKTTDTDYKLFFTLLKNNETKALFQKYHLIQLKNLQRNMHNIQQIRQAIFKRSISFKREFSYYMQLNKELMSILRNLILKEHKYNNLSMVIYDIQYIQEMFSVNRSYIYTKILYRHFNNNALKMIEKILYTQSIYQKDFFADANQQDLKIYKNTINIHLENQITGIINNILQHQQADINAQKWFRLNSRLINEYRRVSSVILHLQTQKTIHIYKKTKFSLIIILTILFISSILILILLYFLHLLLKNEEINKIELKMLSYMFDLNEAMIIADAKGNILRVNNAFTMITGYSQEEIVGKNPNILNSAKHSKEFFKNMWESLLTKGRWSGEIYDKRKNKEIYPVQLSITAIKNNDGQITNYIATCTDILKLKQAKDDATYQAQHDFLTKLPNRQFMLKKLEEEFEKVKTTDFSHAFLFIDLDGFKEVNDTFGHEIGDKLLIQVSYRLKQSVRENDFVARIGGDEFAIILLNLNRQNIQNHIQIIATKIIKDISKIFRIYNNSIQIGASIGIEIFSHDFDNIDTIIKNADAAMYKAKKNGRNQCAFYAKS